MAGKKSAGEFNMAAEIRKLLRQSRSLSAREAMEALKMNFPGQTINSNSYGVAYYGARKALGIKSKRRRSKKKTEGTSKLVRKRVPAKTVQAADLNALQAAAKYVSEVGDASKAIEAIRQLHALQIR